MLWRMTSFFINFLKDVSVHCLCGAGIFLIAPQWKSTREAGSVRGRVSERDLTSERKRIPDDAPDRSPAPLPHNLKGIQDYR